MNRFVLLMLCSNPEGKLSLFIFFNMSAKVGKKYMIVIKGLLILIYFDIDITFKISGKQPFPHLPLI
jgi:hypothetical protein